MSAQLWRVRVIMEGVSQDDVPGACVIQSVSAKSPEYSLVRGFFFTVANTLTTQRVES